MITLVESVELPIPFEKLTAWAENFAEEFAKWSPYHLERELLTGGIQIGDRVRFYKIVMEVDYDVCGTIVESLRTEDRFKFSFLSDKKTVRVAFEGERIETGCR